MTHLGMPLGRNGSFLVGLNMLSSDITRHQLADLIRHQKNDANFTYAIHNLPIPSFFIIPFLLVCIPFMLYRNDAFHVAQMVLWITQAYIIH